MAVKVKYKKTIYGGRKCYQEIKKGRYYTFENDEWCLASKDYEKTCEVNYKIEIVN